MCQQLIAVKIGDSQYLGYYFSKDEPTIIDQALEEDHLDLNSINKEFWKSKALRFE